PKIPSTDEGVLPSTSNTCVTLNGSARLVNSLQFCASSEVHIAHHASKRGSQSTYGFEKTRSTSTVFRRTIPIIDTPVFSGARKTLDGSVLRTIHSTAAF